MSKKKEIFDIQIEQPLMQVKKHEEKRKDKAIEQALTVILKQLEVIGYREGTLYDYSTIVHYFIRDTNIVDKSIFKSKSLSIRFNVQKRSTPLRVELS